MVREDALLEYMRKTNQVIIWPLLIEKRVKNWYKQRGDRTYKYLQSGGYVMMDAKGRIKHEIRQYEKIYLSGYERWINKHIKTVVKKIQSGLREVGIKLHIVKLSEDEWMDYNMREYLMKSKKEEEE